MAAAARRPRRVLPSSRPHALRGRDGARSPSWVLRPRRQRMGPHGLRRALAARPAPVRLGSTRAALRARTRFHALTFMRHILILLAYVVVQKRVHLTSRDSTGGVQAERTRFAWLSVYEKQGSERRMT